MKYFKILVFLTFLAPTLVSQDVNVIVKPNKNIESFTVLQNNGDTKILYKSKGELFLFDEAVNFPGKKLSHVDDVSIKNNFFIAKKNKSYGVLKPSLEEFYIPAEHSRLAPIKNTDLFYVSELFNGRVLDLNNKQVMENQPYRHFNSLTKLGKIGNGRYIFDYKTKKGEYQIKTIPDNIVLENDPVDLFILKNNKVMLKYKNPNYWEIYDDGTKLDKQLNLDGKPIKGCKEGIVFKQKDKQGFIDNQGEIMLPFEYKTIYCKNKNDNHLVKKIFKQGVFNLQKGFVIDTIYKFARLISEEDEIYLLVDNNASYLYSKKNDMILDSCKTASVFGNYLIVGNYASCGLVSKTGDLIYEKNWSYAKKLFDDILIVTKGKKQALMDDNAEFITLFQDAKYKKYKQFFIKKTMKDGSVKYYDRFYSEISESRLNFKVIKLFKNTLLVKNKFNKFGLIDSNLKPIIPFKYDKIKHLSGNYFSVKKGKKTGLVKVNIEEL